MLEIKNLKVNIENKEILKGLNLTINKGEVHAIMGPNGTGKSTLASVIAGNPNFEVTDGEILFMGENLLDKSIEERAKDGIFIGFQYPVEVPGVNMSNFMRTALNEKRKHKGLDPLSAGEFIKIMNEKKKLVNLDSNMINRSLNTGFSGGEKKKNEIFQMAMLEPVLSILDETDSGLDIDALKVVSNGVNALRSNETSTILITHYQRLLDYIVPDFVHVMYDGKIVKSGDKDLALILEKEGYKWLEEL